MHKRKVYAKRKTVYTVIICIALMAALSVTVAAWIANRLSIENEPFSASSVSAYFAGGTGAEGDPFLITRREHIYNLAWLQYLGFFNQDLDGDGMIDQKYFRLENDVDMQGLIIPPIGTTENPFVGNFNGQNHTITGATVSNYMSTSEGDGGLVEAPSSVDYINNSIGDEADKSIVGFFGVVGDWNDALAGKLHDDTNIQIRSKTNAVYDFRLDGLTIRSDTDESLMGLIAGYVNGSLQNVGIGESALVLAEDVKALNISGIEMQSIVSRYSLIGEYNADDVEWPDKPVLGGWGESMDMLGMYNRLSNIVIPKTELVEYVSKITYTYDEDGNLVSRTEETAETNEIWSVDLPNGLGSYTFSTHTNSDAYGSAQNVANYQFKYLYGPVTYDQVTVERRISSKQTYISLGSNYLSINTSNSIANTTEANALPWELTADGYLKIVRNTATRYLNINTGTLALTAGTSGATKWTRSVIDGVGTLTAAVGNKQYALFFNGSSWVVNEIGITDTFYKISNGAYYLNASSGSITSGTSSDTASLWAFSGSGTSGTASSGGYYLYAEQSRSGSGFSGYDYSYSFGLNASEGTSFTNGGNNLYVNLQTASGGWFGGSDEYADFYLSCNSSGTWSLQQGSGASLTFTPIEVQITADNYKLDFPVYYEETTTTEQLMLCDNATWTPLLTGTDENGNEYVLPGNTGYIVSSSDFDQNNGTLKRAGNIRVSQYSKSGNVANSLNNSNNALDHSAVYTISYKNQSFGTIGSLDGALSTWGFTKYELAAEQFNEVIATDSNVYGLHFMQTSKNISKEDIITIDGATVFLSDRVSHTIDNYQLPRNAITFNVAEDGYVNFFAGTYFGGNETFFSLHHIERAENLATINSIKEISKIYGKLTADGSIDETVDYIYGYTDGSFSEGNTVPSEYTVVFDTMWITDPDTIGMRESYIYYFEIPVNAGEYALGSVVNSDGAYLLYLDLAANGSANVGSDIEHSIMGVNFVDDAGLETEDIEIYPGMSASLALDAGVTAHGGAEAVFNRTSADNIDYALGGTSADSFGLAFVTMDGSTATENNGLLTEANENSP